MKTFYVLFNGHTYLQSLEEVDVFGDICYYWHPDIGGAKRFESLCQALDFNDSSGLQLEVLRVEIASAWTPNLFTENLPNMKNKIEQQTLVELEYWKQRCLMAEKFIDESPCDPDITPEQIDAYSNWQYFVNQENKK